MTKKIVVHGGQAHADDILSIALVMLMENLERDQLEIVRVNDGRARDWPDADLVIDVGKDYDPRKGWFDHHQFPREAAPSCAFKLLAKHYGLDLNNLFWAEKLSIVDSKGPKAWVRKLLGRDPVDGKEFGQVMSEGDSFMCYVADVSNKDFDKGLTLAREWLSFKLKAATERKMMIATAKSVLKVVDLDKGMRMAFFDTKVVGGTIQVSSDLQDEDPDVVVSAMRDDRSDGLAAYRVNDDRRVDFSPRESDDGCLFAHKSGFCLKFKNDWEGFVKAINKSIKP